MSSRSASEPDRSEPLVLIRVPNGCLSQSTRHGVMDWREDKVLLDGLNGSDWTVTTRLWSRLLQVRALPPEQVKVLVDVPSASRAGAGSGANEAQHAPKRAPEMGLIGEACLDGGVG